MRLERERRNRPNVWFIAALLCGAFGVQSGCGSDAPPSQEADGGSNALRLRPTISVDLAKVQSLAVLRIDGAGKALTDARRWHLTASALRDGDLVALMDDGDVEPVALTEPPTGPQGGLVPQIFVTAIHPTTAWILLQTNDLMVVPAGAPDGTAPVSCRTVAVRRSDGALFCAPLAISSVGDNYGNVREMDRAVKSAADGEPVFVLSRDGFNRNILYRFESSPDGAPVATLLDPGLHPDWFVVNARGDLLASELQPAAGDGISAMSLYPVDGSAAVTVTGEHNAAAIAGASDGAQADTFYVLIGGGGGWPFEGKLRVIEPEGTAFAQSLVAVTLAEQNCSDLLWLADDIVTVCGSQNGHVLVTTLIHGGAVDPNPKQTIVEGAAKPVSFGGLAWTSGAGVLVLLAQTTGGIALFRLDGLVQTVIPLPSSWQVLGMSVSGAGAIDVLAIDDAQQRKVRATVAPGSAELVEVAAEGVELAETVAFVRID